MNRKALNTLTDFQSEVAVVLWALLRDLAAEYGIPRDELAQRVSSNVVIQSELPEEGQLFAGSIRFVIRGDE